MVNPIDDFITQARSGSVAAIIQVLNDKLAASRVRTRAVFEKGVLQLLCEANSSEDLEKSFLVERIREILEWLEPYNITKVRINSRLVKEQQILWLEAIQQNPEKELLWFYDLTLKQPKFFDRLFAKKPSNFASQNFSGFKAPTIFSSRLERSQRDFWQGILVGCLGLSALLLLLGWALQQSFPLALAQKNVLLLRQGGNEKPLPGKQQGDTFADAVRLAEQTSALGKQAQTKADWLVIAAKWDQASALMAAVPSTHPRYDVAQNRAALYREYGVTAQQEAQKRQ